MAITGSQSSMGGQLPDNFKIDEGSPLWKHTMQDYHKFPEVAHIFGSVIIVEVTKANHSIAHILESNIILWALLIKDLQCAKAQQILVPGEEEEEVEINACKRGPLDTAFKMEARELVDEAIARCLYVNGLPFNLIRSPYWKEMVQAINKAPVDYISPGYEKVCTILLQKERSSIEIPLQPIKNSQKTSSITIVTYGWKDTKNRPLINVIGMSPKGAMFFRVVDCEGQVKDSQFISRILIEAIKIVGSENVD